MKTALLIAVGCLLLAGPVQAAPDSLQAWADVRISDTTGETGWRDDGFGKLRYGVGARTEIAQAAVLWTPQIGDDTLIGHVLLQSVPGGPQPLGVSEAYIRWKPIPTSPVRYAVRLGQMFPPISLEHDGPGWTTTRSLTPSVINAWIGEEVLVDGVEGNVRWSAGSQGFGLTTAVFMGADTAGTLLTFRGWAQHDLVSGNGTKLPLPSSPPGLGWAATFTRQSADSRPLVEIDGRAGGYVRFDWQPPAPLAFNLIVYDNPGNPAIVRHGQYAWTTRFAAVGMVWRLTAQDEVLAQSLAGTTMMGASLPDGRHPADIGYGSAYVLLCHHFTNGAVITGGRLETFAITDRSLQTIDDNRDSGHSATLAYMRPLTAHLDLAVEALTIASDHPARLTQGVDTRQDQTQLQLAFKLHL